MVMITPVQRRVTPGTLAPRLVRTEIFGNRTSVFPVQFESNSPPHCIQSGNEIAVASDAFNGTLLTSLSLLYEYALSFLFSLGHDRRLFDDCLGAKPAEHDAATAFSDHE